MSQAKFRNNTLTDHRGPNLLFPVLTIWGIGLVALISYILYDADFGYGEKFYLLPWSFLTAGVISAPAFFLLYKGKFDPFHPLVFPAWSYFLPAFFVGGILLAFGLVEPYYLAYVEDEKHNFPLTFVYIISGYLGLIVGFLLPIGLRLGKIVSGWLPKWDFKGENVAMSGMILLGLGLANTLLAFTLGVFGFQKVDERGIFDGLVYLLSLFFAEASVLLWLYIFRQNKLGLVQIIVVATLILTSFSRSVFQGNRGIFINTFIMIAFAFVLSGRKITFRSGSLGTSIALVAVVFGMIYGTTFRSIKEDQSVIAFDKYADVVATTFEQVGSRDLNENLTFGFIALGERLEAVSTLAVIVSNYEKFAHLEELYGIDNNIWKDMVVFFIPRIVWPDKPVAIEPTKYADLYFNFSENSFTVTPIGDLLRNYGPLGVPLGMLILGVLIRFLYAALHENQAFSYWRATLYYMLLTSISYEGTYGLILPMMFKVGVITVVGLLIVRFFAGANRENYALS